MSRVLMSSASLNTSLRHPGAVEQGARKRGKSPRNKRHASSTKNVNAGSPFERILSAVHLVANKGELGRLAAAIRRAQNHIDELAGQRRPLAADKRTVRCIVNAINAKLVGFGLRSLVNYDDLGERGSVWALLELQQRLEAYLAARRHQVESEKRKATPKKKSVTPVKRRRKRRPPVTEPLWLAKHSGAAAKRNAHRPVDLLMDPIGVAALAEFVRVLEGPEPAEFSERLLDGWRLP